MSIESIQRYAPQSTSSPMANLLTNLSFESNGSETYQKEFEVVNDEALTRVDGRGEDGELITMIMDRDEKTLTTYVDSDKNADTGLGGFDNRITVNTQTGEVSNIPLSINATGEVVEGEAVQVNVEAADALEASKEFGRLQNSNSIENQQFQNLGLQGIIESLRESNVAAPEIASQSMNQNDIELLPTGNGPQQTKEAGFGGR